MATKPSGFYSYIQESKHHDVWKIIVLVFVLAVAGVLVWLFSSGTTSAFPPGTSNTNASSRSLTDTQREAIMAAPSGVAADTSLSDKQRTAVMKSTSKTTTPDTTMTDAERRRLMSSQ